MEADDLILVSVDDHLIEPPDLFANHLDTRYADRAPKLVRTPDGSDVWKFGEVDMETAALNAVAGRPKEEFRRRRADGHDVSIMSRRTRVRTPDEKLEGFRRRARRAVAAGR